VLRVGHRELPDHLPIEPDINTGAITVTALLHARHRERALDHLLARLGAAAGRQFTVDEAVYQSEHRTGHRNRAIAHLLLNFGTSTARRRRPSMSTSGNARFW